MRNLLKVHAQVALVKGFSRAAVYDLQREKYYFMRLAIADFLQHKLPCERELLDEALGEHYEPATEYSQWLIDNELIFAVPEELIWNFPAIADDVNIPGRLLSATVSAVQVSAALVDALCALGVRHLIVDCRGMSLQAAVEAIPRIPVEAPLSSITIWGDSEQMCAELQASRAIQARLSVVGALRPQALSTSTASSPADMMPAMRCNLTHFLHARRFNAAFHMHIDISAKGALAEGNGVSRAIGQLDATDPLKSLLDSETKRGLDGAKKDRTHICRDCEFRYMCTDPREPLQADGSEWYHATECKYNPYICKWKGEEGYRTLAECGVVSNAEGFSIDHERIAAINAELWVE